MPAFSESFITTLAIDPGTTRLGFSLMTIDLDSRLIISSQAFTLNGEKLSNNQMVSDHYGARHGRIQGMMTQLARVCEHYQPFAVISESPFYNPTRPAAFEALVEVINALRMTVANYDLFKPLHLIDPSSVKNAVGSKGGANKVTIREAILKIPQLNYHDQNELIALDEHAIDSLAVNYWYYLNYLKTH